MTARTTAACAIHIRLSAVVRTIPFHINEEQMAYKAASLSINTILED